MQEIIQLVKDEFSAVLSDRQIKLLQPQTPVEVNADKLSLLRVFRNFVDNALKYGGDELGEIRIEYMPTEANHQFSVSDDGVGIKQKFGN